MPKKRLSLQTLCEVGAGLPAAAFNRELRLVIEDCQERMHDMSPRKVTMTLEIRPKENGPGLVDVTITTNNSVPKQRTRSYEMGLTDKVGMEFRPDVPDDVNQSSFEDLKEKNDHVE